MEAFFNLVTFQINVVGRWYTVFWYPHTSYSVDEAEWGYTRYIYRRTCLLGSRLDRAAAV